MHVLRPLCEDGPCSVAVRLWGVTILMTATARCWSPCLASPNLQGIIQTSLIPNSLDPCHMLVSSVGEASGCCSSFFLSSFGFLPEAIWVHGWSWLSGHAEAIIVFVQAHHVQPDPYPEVEGQPASLAYPELAKHQGSAKDGCFDCVLVRIPVPCNQQGQVWPHQAEEHWQPGMPPAWLVPSCVPPAARSWVLLAGINGGQLPHLGMVVVSFACASLLWS